MLPELFFSLALICGAAYLVLRGIRALEVGRGRPADLDTLAEEIELLREQHQQLGAQIASLREGQEFARQLRTPNTGGEAGSAAGDATT